MSACNWLWNALKAARSEAAQAFLDFNCEEITKFSLDRPKASPVFREIVLKCVEDMQISNPGIPRTLFLGVVKARTPIFRVLCWGPQNSFLMFPLCFDSNFYIIGFFEIALIPESTGFHTKMCLNMKEFIISWHAFFLV